MTNVVFWDVTPCGRNRNIPEGGILQRKLPRPEFDLVTRAAWYYMAQTNGNNAGMGARLRYSRSHISSEC
jgi:hypothetical protein